MSAEALKPLEELQTKYDELKKEHENFKSIHQEALNKSKLYDTDILDKYTKIKVDFWIIFLSRIISVCLIVYLITLL